MTMARASARRGMDGCCDGSLAARDLTVAGIEARVDGARSGRMRERPGDRDRQGMHVRRPQLARLKLYWRS